MKYDLFGIETLYYCARGIRLLKIFINRTCEDYYNIQYHSWKLCVNCGPCWWIWRVTNLTVLTIFIKNLIMSILTGNPHSEIYEELNYSSVFYGKKFHFFTDNSFKYQTDNSIKYLRLKLVCIRKYVREWKRSTGRDRERNKPLHIRSVP